MMTRSDLGATAAVLSRASLGPAALARGTVPVERLLDHESIGILAPLR